MSKKIFRSMIAVVMVVLLASSLITGSFFYNYFHKSQVSRLKEALLLASTGVEQMGTEYLDRYDSSLFRFTLVSAEGYVIYDTEVKSKLGNHLDREEIAAAIQNGSGSSSRYSSTLTKRTFYEAIRLENGNILRISTVQITVGALIISMLPAIGSIILLSVVLSTIMSKKMAQSIVKPLETLDLDHPDDNDTYEELTPVLGRLGQQHSQIEQQMQQLKQKSDEFQQIIGSMKESLILLDPKGIIISINKAGKDLFQTDSKVLGSYFQEMEQSSVMRLGVEKALSGKHSQFREGRNGFEYQFMVTPIESGGKILGAVILGIDVTERAFAEQNRREFTANVSHELKTPLQSIIGSAELLENGLVREEDTGRFIENIKQEASRLVVLINDIIRLSQLDEKVQLPTETIDIYEVAKEVQQILQTEADKKKVTVAVAGQSCKIQGVRRYLYEILYNLCENGIRYNKEGGKVWIILEADPEHKKIKVCDTGIGIPPEDQSRVFERFYRVDKSHSKETGGTGLGLSIVKHAVSCHGGEISLESTLGQGTTMTITFPSEND